MSSQSGGSDGEPGRGIRGTRTTGAFRAINFELFARPRKSVMVFGAVCMTFCVGYLLFLNMNSEGNQLRHRRDTDTSRTRWDS